MIQVSGLRFSHDHTQVPGSRVRAVQIGDAPLDDARSYRVATNSLPAGGGHHYRTFLEGGDRQERGSQYEMIAAWIQRHGKVSAPTDVRIESVGAH